MNSEACSHSHEAPTSTLRGLHESQAGELRHKCCVCAYYEGYRLGLTQAHQPAGEMEECHAGNRLAKEIIDELPESQAGAGRHRCAICAFDAGLKAGQRETSHTRGMTYKGFGDESKKYQKWARQALPVLVAQAKARNTITYGQLALQLKMSNPRNLNVVLGAVGSELNNLSHEWKQEIPPLTCLVVDKQLKTPQRGIGF